MNFFTDIIESTVINPCILKSYLFISIFVYLDGILLYLHIGGLLFNLTTVDLDTLFNVSFCLSTNDPHIRGYWTSFGYSYESSRKCIITLFQIPFLLIKMIFQNGVFIGSIITCLCILFAGFLVLFNHMSTFLYYVSYSSYMRYALEGLVLAIYGYGRDPLMCSGDKDYCHYRFPEIAFKEIGMKDGRFWIDVSSLSIYLIFILILSYVTLKKNLKSS